ncbi:MAG: NfeD family protein [Candidatus Methanofastidiosia archaeon]
MNEYTIIWWILGFLGLVAEMLTTGFFILWFAIGAFVAGVIALFGGGVLVQIVVFLATSAILIVLSRRFFIHVTPEAPLKANIDDYLGQKAVVVENIDPIENRGLVRVKKEIWRADATEQIEKGEVVKVVGYEGVHLVVKRTKEKGR